ncbi:Hypothetical protein CINCED_3A009213 [Cinara cedri]|uniref:Uncharacterized protein n=1 Tax=Cinara cedri TaxID=506608 RepID=A0A5E4NEL2_9HEMI|nr:Hypothetical protein CINCED_3A009213 [Cinara cedri]
MSRQTVESKIKKDRDIALEAIRRLIKCDPGDEIVISGFSGSFPNCDGLRDFAENLFNKVDLISDDDRRWTIGHPEIPQRTGKLNQLKRFDAAFFGINYEQAHTMDPMCRIILEKSYEAIVDSGNSPKSLKGTKTGVFVGACFSESEKTCFYDKLQKNGFGITGCTRSMLANRISYWLGVNGPSYSVDSACSSSLFALENAYKSIRNGQCDSALVGGLLSMDGRCKSFDEAANGYVRSEAVCVIYLQKAKNAKRVYAYVKYANTNCDGYKERGISYPSRFMQQRLLEDFYEECEIKPCDLAWVEAHGTGTKVGDPEEVQALENVFCPGRTEPLLIGSVKSNIGHSEAVSGLCAIAKVIIAMESGYIPPNIHFNTPRKDITSFYNNRINVVTEKTSWNGGMVGINSFGYGGANSHVLLNWNEKNKINNGLPEDDLPRLVVASGRTEEAVTIILNDVLSKPLDKEYVRLLHDIQAEEIPGHHYRGYTILTKDSKKTYSLDFQYYSGEPAPVCFVFTGLGSQWTRMGTSLMKLPIFNESIQQYNRILLEFGIDLIRIITNTDHLSLNNAVDSIVGIIAMEIALFDLLTAIGITSDVVIGDSIGELGCAYADGCLTAEQTLKAAYNYGLAIMKSKLPLGAMAFVNIRYSDIKHMLPINVEVTWHNSQNSCIIYGLKKSVEEFALQLESKDISTKILNVFNTPYHSKLIKKAMPSLLENLKKIVPYPKLRTDKWISTSVPEEQWGTDKANYCSAEYLVNNLLNSVLIDESFNYVPKGSAVIELALDGILCDIINRTSEINIYTFDLASMDKNDGLRYILSVFGKLFEIGINPKISKLYPEIEFPVSRGTPMIAPLIRWNHSEEWHVTKYDVRDHNNSGERKFLISLNEEEFEYLSGHIIDGKNLFPDTGYLVMAWETLALMKGKLYSEVSVIFENIRFERVINISKDSNVEFIVMVQRVSGEFEVIESGTPVATGRLYIPIDVNKEMIDMPPHPYKPNSTDLNIKDVYKELKLRGYNYGGLFRSLNRVNIDVTVGRIGWFNNWVSFIDNMLQLRILNEDTRSLLTPVSLESLVINVDRHSLVLQTLSEKNSEIPVYVYPEMDLIKSGGIEIRGLHVNAIPKRKPLDNPVVEKYMFIPYTIDMGYTLEDIVRICLHIAIENNMAIKIKTLEILNQTIKPDERIISPMILDIITDLPLVQAEVCILSNKNHPQLKEVSNNITVKNGKLPTDQSVLFIVGSKLLEDAEVLENVFDSLKPEGFLLTREQLNFEPSLNLVEVCFDVLFKEERLMLVRKPIKQNEVPIVIKISSKEFSWLPVLQKTLSDDASIKQKVILVAEKDPTNGIMGLFNCVRKETGGDRTRCVFIMDECAPPFSLEDPLYKNQLKKDLALNVYKNNVWGSYKHLLLEPLSLVEAHHCTVNFSNLGEFSSLKWFSGHIVPYTDQPDKSKIVHIYYTALNDRDIMLATAELAPEVVSKSRISQENVLGIEYAGRSEKGERVMGMIASQALTTLIECDPYLLWQVPNYWSLEEAATVPVVYGTVIYALVVSGRIKRGDSILIHAGDGAVGQAAIHLALYYKCEIFTTVKTPEKRKFIRTHFPLIPESHIGSSRDSSFEQMIMMETDGKGIDMVLNSLTEEKLLASVRCLATGGRFLEIGNFDLASNIMLDMELFFLKKISFHGVMLDTLLTSSAKFKQSLQCLLQEHINLGAIKPIVRTVFESVEVVQAFRYMAAGKHIGKVVIKIRSEEKERVIQAVPLTQTVQPRIMFDKNSSCIICGGLGGFGLELVDWMVLRNARNIVLATRTGLRTGYQALRKRIWESYGVKVVISTADITTDDGVKQLFNEANQLAPVSTIFNLAVVLKDALFENQTVEDFIVSCRPKAIATSLLDKYSRIMCPDLKHFVIFSSVTCSRGNIGQTNYGLSNSVMERICEIRRSEGLPALAIEWGAIGDVGLATSMAEGNKEVVVSGTKQQNIANSLEIMDHLLIQKNYPIVTSIVVAEKSAKKCSNALVDTVIDILGHKDFKNISLHSTLAELGIDSMMTVEIKHLLEVQLEVFLMPKDIRGITFTKLQEFDALDYKEKQCQLNKFTTVNESIELELLPSYYSVAILENMCL